MKIMREWFLPGESDLLMVGLVLMLIAALIPWEKTKQWGDRFVLGCALVYCLCEVLVTFWGTNMGLAIFSVLLGGSALSLAVGGILRKGILALWQRLRPNH